MAPKGTGSGSRGGGSKPTRRFVTPRKDGGYAVEGPKSKRASSIEPTKKAAEKRAKEIVQNLGGGEVTFKDKQGRIIDSDTVRPGNDPNPPKDTKH